MKSCILCSRNTKNKVLYDTPKGVGVICNYCKEHGRIEMNNCKVVKNKRSDCKMDSIDYKEIAKKYHTEKTYNHVLRVANFVSENPLIPEQSKEFCVNLAYMHDIIEDTEFPIEEIKDRRFKECLLLLTKKDDEGYVEYIQVIREMAYMYPEVYWVKLADMKDHLSQTETLTSRLKEKYLTALPHLL